MVNKDFFLALDAIEREKGIDKELIINALEKALAISGVTKAEMRS